MQPFVGHRRSAPRISPMSLDGIGELSWRRESAGSFRRGNSVNGLITPCRPMSLEAAAGKNPVTHVGRIYNVAARDIVETLVATVPEIVAAQSLIVSRIGAPVTNPAMIQFKIATRDGIPVDKFKRQGEDVTADRLARIPETIDDCMAARSVSSELRVRRSPNRDRSVARSPS